MVRPAVTVLCAFALSAQTGPETLRVIVVEGQGAINNIRDRTARAPVVRVEDSQERPVAGATVNFTLPDLGASGYFPDGGTTFSTTTDQNGVAGAHGLRPNNVAGQFQIRVMASHQGQTGSATINQVNVAPAAAAKKKSKAKYIVLAVVGAGAAGGVGIALSRGKGSNGGGGTNPPPGGTTITPGSPVVGPPR